ncbi:MAG: hypothetical protein ACOYVK_14810 [Bacillota bacterium]
MKMRDKHLAGAYFHINRSDKMKCPNCKSDKIGKIGAKRYYCRDCYFEFVERQNKIILYAADEDGKQTKIYTIQKRDCS